MTPDSTVRPRVILPPRISRLSPLSITKTFSGGMPIVSASLACVRRCSDSPWTGMKFLGLVSAIMSLSSSCDAWPETCTRQRLLS